MAVSLLESVSGGALDAVEATITKARALGAYPGKTDQAALLAITYLPRAKDAKERTELYSLGKTQLKPSADGKQFEEIVKGSGARAHSNSFAITFWKALIAAGFDAAKIGNDVSVIEGTVVFLRTKARDKTGNAEIDKNNDGKTITLPEKVIAMPGEATAAVGTKKAAPSVKKAAAQAPAAAPAPEAPAVEAPAEAPAADGADYASIETEAEKVVSAVLTAAADNTVPANRIGNGVFQALAKAKTEGKLRAAIMGVVNKDKGAWMQSESRPWYYNAEKQEFVGQPAAELAEAA